MKGIPLKIRTPCGRYGGIVDLCSMYFRDGTLPNLAGINSLNNDVYIRGGRPAELQGGRVTDDSIASLDQKDSTEVKAAQREIGFVYGPKR